MPSVSLHQTVFERLHAPSESAAVVVFVPTRADFHVSVERSGPLEGSRGGPEIRTAFFRVLFLPELIHLQEPLEGAGRAARRGEQRENARNGTSPHCFTLCPHSLHATRRIAVPTALRRPDLCLFIRLSVVVLSRTAF